MTLKVVADNTVTELPVGNLRDIAAMARRFADEIDAGKHGAVDRVICIAENERGLDIFGWGENTTAYELMGMFEAAKLRVFAEGLVDD